MMALDNDQDLEILKLKPLQLAGKELWLISLPFEVQLQKLAGQKLHITNDSSIEQELESSTETKYVFSTAKKDPKQNNIVPIIPSGKTGKLSPGPKCKGEIVIKRSIKINKTKKPRFNTRTVTTPLGLKQRWRPFGWKKPLSSKSIITQSKVKTRKLSKNKSRSNK